ncbi:Gfo/Idh/MocA family oxidoreductase [Sphaerimonospora thailandensis]|uniref:Gfo/Idh/MocA-like oxidoreductase N-terminal domain-containing protein n=1 Tax=Sphaerimonospora thailandensis TaxID=795644 RepID=A0A8J3VXZ1_9ACTN|nr:hypothetical protein Mth01_06730 [Sphaerimonospora thailandensis]
MSDSPLRVGVIGVGLMGADHAERLAHRIAAADLVTVCDPGTARAAAPAARFDDGRRLVAARGRGRAQAAVSGMPITACHDRTSN